MEGPTESSSIASVRGRKSRRRRRKEEEGGGRRRKEEERGEGGGRARCIRYAINENKERKRKLKWNGTK